MTTKAESNTVLKWNFICKYCKKDVVMVEGSGIMYEGDEKNHYSVKCPICRRRTMLYQ